MGPIQYMSYFYNIRIIEVSINVGSHLDRSMSHKFLCNSNIDAVPCKVGTVFVPEAIGNQIRS